MIEVMPIKAGEAEEVNRIIKTWGRNERLSPYSLAMLGYINKTLEGIAVIKFHSEGFAEIERFIINAKNDFEFEYVLGSGTLNFIDRRGFGDVYSTDETSDKILKMLKFKEIDNLTLDIYKSSNKLYFLSLTDYFAAGKCRRS